MLIIKAVTTDPTVKSNIHPTVKFEGSLRIFVLSVDVQKWSLKHFFVVRKMSSP